MAVHPTGKKGNPKRNPGAGVRGAIPGFSMRAALVRGAPKGGPGPTSSTLVNRKANIGDRPLTLDGSRTSTRGFRRKIAKKGNS